ncbi:putative Kv channel-interacting protein 2-like [Scophthalmus maximus]|uniref:Putative Kv channel-interacting protein 2-like n=1 Tax=Scophthalmus maximus TaxID=52904 RepID=A0A2U9CBS0_SCOMX|nr:putative Kv channel-interacting protein 2-like [Scophthalmus maximus]
MKAKNRDQSLSDSRELDGSYDQLTGEMLMPAKSKISKICTVLQGGVKFDQLHFGGYNMVQGTSAWHQNSMRVNGVY